MQEDASNPGTAKLHPPAQSGQNDFVWVTPVLLPSRKILPLFGALLLLPGYGLSQVEPPLPSAQPAASSAAQQEKFELVLREGTPVPLKLAQDLNSKYAVRGENVELVLAEDLKVYDTVVVKKGARVLGTVTAGKRDEKRGDAHELSIRIDFLKAGAIPIKLRGQQTAQGKRNKDAMVAATIVLGLPGLLSTSGKHYVIPAGAAALAYVDEDVSLPPAP